MDKKNGIIKSLKFRGNLNKEIKSLDPNSSSYFTTKQDLSVYNQLLKIREAKTMYYNNEFNKNRSNMRKMWNTLSEIIHKQRNNNISVTKIFVQGKCINDQTEIANIFNDLFINIGPNLTKNIIAKITLLKKIHKQFYFVFFQFSVNWCWGMIKNLKLASY